MEGDSSLSKRPMKRVSEPLKKFGAKVELSDQGTLPAIVHGKKLHEATIKMDVASAQVKSALILRRFMPMERQPSLRNCQRAIIRKSCSEHSVLT